MKKIRDFDQNSADSSLKIFPLLKPYLLFTYLPSKFQKLKQFQSWFSNNTNHDPEVDLDLTAMMEVL